MVRIVKKLETSKETPKGIHNVSNFCYFNSVIQSLISNVDLKNKFLNKKFSKNQVVSSAFKEFLEDYKNQKSISPSRFVNSLKKKITMLKYQDQEDAHEFLILFIDNILNENFKDEYKVTKEFINEVQKNFFAEKFSGVMRLNFECAVCKNETKDSIYEEFRVLTVRIKKNIAAGVKDYFKISLIDKDCTFCGSKNKTVRKVYVEQAPNFLIVHIARFTPSKEKDSRKIEIDKSLTLKDKSYEICAVLCHSGSLNNGHYVSYVKTSSGWICCDDSSIYKKNPSLDCSNVYIAFYSQIDVN